MKVHKWLCMPKSRNTWCYGLARFEDGSIRVVEVLFSDSFGEVGTTGDVEPVNIHSLVHGRKPLRLYNNERRLIIQDLYMACCKELGIDWDEAAITLKSTLRD